MKLNGKTRFIAIFGWPLTYTRSPVFQNAGLNAAGINAVYVPLPVKTADFSALWKSLSRVDNFLGANVTNPHKQMALRLADKLTPEARAIGAVNTLFRRGKSWIGDNTDARGFLAALPMRPKNRRALIFGAGGTSRAMAYALLKSGTASLEIACRRPAQGYAMLRALKVPKHRAAIRDMGKEKLSEIVGTAEMVFNTIPDMAFSAQLGHALKFAKSLRLAFDANYALSGNKFLEAAEKKACWSGALNMLLEQGFISFRYWAGKPAPKAVMRRALGH